MIKTRADLKYYISSDTSRCREGKPNIKDFLLGNEWWYVYHYMKHLRCLEYHLNNNHKIRTFFYTLIHKIDCNRLHIYTYPNRIGPGLRFYHIGGFTEITRRCVIGKNCTI